MFKSAVPRASTWCRPMEAGSLGWGLDSCPASLWPQRRPPRPASFPFLHLPPVSRVLCVGLMWFQMHCLWCKWSCFNLLLYDKGQKRLFWKYSCFDMRMKQAVSGSFPSNRPRNVGSWLAPDSGEPLGEATPQAINNFSWIWTLFLSSPPLWNNSVINLSFVWIMLFLYWFIIRKYYPACYWLMQLL